MKTIIMLMVTCFASSSIAAVRAVEGWKISGILELAEPEISTKELLWATAWHNGEKWASMPRTTKIKLAVDEKKTFSFSPNESATFKTYAGKYRFIFLYRGQLSEVAEVELTKSGQKIEGLKINFFPPGDRVLAMKIVNIETGKPVAGLAACTGFDQTDPILFGFSSISYSESNKDGELVFRGLPEGNFDLGTSGWPHALSYGAGIRKADRMPSITKEEYERQKAADELPILYVLPKDSRKGILWKRMKVTYQKRFGHRFDFIPPGATLEFAGPYKSPNKEGSAQKHFKLTLDENGWLKTPLLDRGWYNIKLVANTGDEYEDVIMVEGIMTCSNFELPDEPPGVKKAEMPEKEEGKADSLKPSEGAMPSAEPTEKQEE